VKFKHVTFALTALMVAALLLAGASLTYAQGSAQGAACAQSYTVVSGDTLGNIAEKFLGDKGLYQQIADATNAAAKTDSSFATIADPNVLEVGWKLCIPAKAGGTTTAPAANLGGAAAGLYTKTEPAADASNLVTLLTLDANGGMVRTMSYLGKSNFAAKGYWSQSGNTVTVTFTEDNGKPVSAVVVFTVDGDKLTTTQDDSKQFGAPGFVLTKTSADVVALSGVYNTTLKNPDSTEHFIGLTLPPDGTVLWIENVTGKDSVQKTGTWSAAGTKATVNLTKQGDQTIQENYVFELQGTNLVATEYDKAMWADGLTLNHVQDIGATTATAPTTPAPAPTPVPAVAPLTLTQLGNATYNVQDAPGGKVTLKDGKAEVEIAPGSATKYTAQISEPLANGTLNGKPYAAAILITSGGGSGTFYNLAVVPNENGNPGAGVTVLLGDRIQVASAAFQNDAVQVNYLDRKPEDSFATEPSVPVTKYFVMNAAGALVEGQPSAGAAPIGGTGFASTWLASSPAADASALLKTMVLAQDGSATLSNNYVGKGVVLETGTWEQTSETAATVTFTKMDDRNISDALTFELNGDTLTATKWDQGVYGENPPTFGRASGTVTGTVSYLEKIALPDNAVVEVYLVDASKQDVPYTYLSGVSFTTNGKQVPLDFAMPYAGSQINNGGNYLLIAFISADGRLLFKNDSGVKVLTGGAPSSGVQIVVAPPAQ
jgi:uncharacterized lipoprotein YbaY